jgi:spore maturation protein CgeB
MAVPPPLAPARAEANWRALERRAPQLALRLRLPCGEGHLRVESGGQAAYRWRGTWQRLELEGAARQGVPLELARGAAERREEVLLFGVGGGETVAAALAGAAPQVLAYDRDPLCLRLLLERYDLAEALGQGRLTLLLGTDLLDWCGPFAPREVRAHRLLGALWPRERRLLERGRRGPAVALAEGRLFVDQVGECLVRLGYDPFTVDLEGLAVEELDRQLARLEPEFLFTINLLPGTAEFCEARGLRHVVWEIDPSTDRLPTLAAPCPRTTVHTYRRAHLPDYAAAGFAGTVYTPLAADTHARRPRTLGAAERERYAADLVFVGASMVDRARACRAEFLGLYRDFAARSGAREASADAALEAALAEQRRDPWTYRLPALLERSCGAFLAEHEARAARGLCRARPLVLAAEIAAAEKRLNALVGLAEFAPVVYGDEGWRTVAGHGVSHRGGAGHQTELDSIYSASRINLDIGRIYQSDIVTMRVFDVLACGGFALVEHSAALEELFEVGAELVSYRDLGELRAQVRHYLSAEEERQAIAARGLRAVRERHDMTLRLAGMLGRPVPA